MKIVDKEDNGAAGNSRRRSVVGVAALLVGSVERRELAFTCTARGDAFEERNRPRFAIDHQLKLSRFSPSTKLPFLSRTVIAV